MQLPPVPPINVTVVAPEHPWYAQPDFWLTVFTLLLVVATMLLVWQTRKVWQRSDLAIGALSRQAEIAATVEGKCRGRKEERGGISSASGCDGTSG
jgi:hypothetical protein